MRIVVAGLALTLFALQYKLWLGDGGVRQWTQVEKKLAIQEQKNQALMRRNQTITADIKELKSGDQAVEEQARLELGMIKRGEVYYHFVD